MIFGSVTFSCHRILRKTRERRCSKDVIFGMFLSDRHTIDSSRWNDVHSVYFLKTSARQQQPLMSEPHLKPSLLGGFLITVCVQHLLGLTRPPSLQFCCYLIVIDHFFFYSFTKYALAGLKLPNQICKYKGRSQQQGAMIRKHLAALQSGLQTFL